MADYTVSTGPVQERVLDYILSRIINPKRVEQGLPTLTKAQFVQFLFNDRVQDAASQAQGRENQDRADKFIAATQTVKDQVDTLLGTDKV